MVLISARTTQVLLNLLVAMLSSTFEKNSREAKQSWQLHRARVIVRIDHRMTAEEREEGGKRYWQETPGSGRFITFNVISKTDSEGVSAAAATQFNRWDCAN